MDQQLFHLINERWTSPALDLFMAALSDGEVWKPLLLIVLFAALIFGGFRAGASCFTLFYRRGSLYWLSAGLVGDWRISLGVHWLSDFIGTAFLAAGETVFMLAALESIWRWAVKRWAPRIFERQASLVVNPVE